MFLGTFDIVFWGSWLDGEMSAYPSFNVDNLGYVIGSQSATYLIGCLILPYTCEVLPRRLLFVIAMFGFGISSFMLGPSTLLNLPQHNMWLPISAFPIMGIFQVFVFIPIIPEMIERLQHDLKITEGEDEFIDGMLNDKVNDMYGLIYALSMFVGPILGSLLETLYGYSGCCDLVALINIGWGTFLFVFNCGPWVFAENRKF